MTHFSLVHKKFVRPFEQMAHRPATSTFFNSSRTDANLFEALGNACLTPVQFLWGGRTISKIDVNQEKPFFESTQRFHYCKTPVYFVQIAFAIAWLIPGLILGTIFKGIGCISSKTRLANKQIDQAFFGRYQTPKLPYPSNPAYTDEAYTQPKIESRHGQKGHPAFIEATRVVSQIAKDANIPLWLEGGSALGLYRYGGMIPWDTDVDMGCIEADMPRLYEALKTKLDPSKYHLEDWSHHHHPETLFRVRIKETGDHIDLLAYSYNPEDQTISLAVINRDSPLVDKWAKESFARWSAMRHPIRTILPLKPAQFDGVTTYCTHDPDAYLSKMYPTYKEPSRTYEPATQKWVRVEGHQYYQTTRVWEGD